MNAVYNNNMQKQVPLTELVTSKTKCSVCQVTRVVDFCGLCSSSSDTRLAQEFLHIRSKPITSQMPKTHVQIVFGKIWGRLNPAALAAFVGMILLWGCGKHPEATYSTGNLAVAQVRAVPVIAKQCVVSEEIPGTVQAKTRATLEAKVAGRITELPVRIGQQVKAGELLARLDADEIKARLDQARASLEQATRDRDRYTALLEQQAVTQAEFDAVLARYRIAEASVREAETMFAYTEVRAPFDGIVNRKFADVGDLAVPGKPLIELETAGAFRLEADVPEAFIDQIKLGTKLAVRIDALDRVLEGVISEIAAGGDAVSRTVHVKIDLPQSPGLRSGLFGRLTLPVAEHTALCVPKSALVKRGQLDLVFVVANGTAQLRLVKPGRHLQDVVELLAGVEPGEFVVVEGAVGLLDGQPVQVR